METNNPIRAFVERVKSLSPHVSSKLRRPLSTRELAQQTAALPKPLVELFQVANGQVGTRIGLIPLLGSQDALALLNLADSIVMAEGIAGSEVLYAGTERRKYDTDPKVRSCFWCSGWYLVAERRQERVGLVTRLFVDFEPTVLGAQGQVVREDWRIGGPQEIVTRVVLADSLTRYFEALAKLPIYYDEKVGVRIGKGSIKGPPAPSLFDPVKLSDATLSRASQVLQRWGEATPAPSQEIHEAESLLGSPLPEDLLRLFRVSREWHWKEVRFDSIWMLSPIEIAGESVEPLRADDRIEVEISMGRGVKPYYYGPLRLTIAQSDYYRFQLDRDPAAGGIVGQIVVIDIESGEIEVFEKCLNDFVERGILQIQRQLDQS